MAAFALVSCLAALFFGDGNIAFFISSSSPLSVNILLAVSAMAVSFIFGITSGDYSWVDRLWSTLPVVFAWVYAAKDGTVILYVLAVCITLWGLRLSFNFARKGGYSGKEDYRWPILKSRIGNPLFWQLFHLFFINGIQISLFVLFTLPLNIIYSIASPRFGIVSAISILLMAGMIVLETIADQQQWDFQQDKKGCGKGKYTEDCRQGFLSSGLFRFSRHPNYFAELAFWCLLYIPAAVVSSSPLNYSLAGPLILILLFIGSTRFTESITAGKYTQYSCYRQRTSVVIPWFPRKG